MTVDDVLPRGRSVVRAVTSTAHCAAVPEQPEPPAATADPAVTGGSRAATVVAAGRAGQGAGSGDLTAAGEAPASGTVVGARVLIVLVALGLLLAARRRRRASSS